MLFSIGVLHSSQNEVNQLFDPVAITIGPYSIRWYGILIACAFALGIWLAYQRAKQQQYSTEHLINLITWIIPCAIIGARLYFVVFEWDYYRYHLAAIPAIWQGGLAIHGGLLGGTIAGLFYLYKHKLSFWQTADIIAPSVILGQAIGRWGNFFNQEAYGGPVSQNFIAHFPTFIQQQMFIGGNYHHPTFLYESLWDLLIFAILLLAWRKRRFPGQIGILYLLLYSLGRFFIEGLRTDSLMLGPLRIAQVISIILFLFGLFSWYWARKHDLNQLKQGNK